jgi:hypothetical protein
MAAQQHDEPDPDVNPTGPVDPGQPPTDPDIHPSSTPEGPSTVPAPSTPEGEPGPDPRPDSPEDSPSYRVQAENAGTSLDQPSDGSGGE